MMRPLDGITLAAAKLRAHRVRTGIITVIVALLFACIMFVLTILAGATSSMRAFGREGLGSRYIVSAKPIIDSNMTSNPSNQALMDTLVAQTTTLKKAKSAEAKRLGIDYDAANDLTVPIQEVAMGSGSEKTKMVNPASSIAQQALTSYIATLPHVKYSDFATLTKTAHASAIYKSVGGASAVTYAAPTSTVSAVVDGTETTQANNQSGQPSGVSQLAQNGWAYFDNELLLPFVLKGQNLAVGKDGSIPVIAPMSAAEQFLKLTAPTATATPKQQIDHLVQVRTAIAGKTAQLCYRNSSSAELLSTAKNQIDEAARNKSNKNYVAPSLQYSLPSDVCGQVTIKKDTRTAEEKKSTEKQLSFRQQFENYEEPAQGIITVRIVGLVPDMTYVSGFSVKDILKNMLQSGLGQGWFVPIGAVKEGSLAARVAPVWSNTTPLAQTYYAEFSTYEAARDFTKNNACSVQLSGQDWAAYGPNQQDPRVKKCYAAGKYFDIMPFGNNASAIEDLRHSVWNVMRYVAPAILFVAALVLMGVVGKIIADSRRETAVFRALGATRSSIVQIYLTYSIYIAVFIAVVATSLGLIGAMFINHKFSPDLSVTAVLAYNAADVHKQFLLFGIDPLYVLVTLGLIIVAALLSTVLPLLTNIRRNPIRDMRDE